MIQQMVATDNGDSDLKQYLAAGGVSNFQVVAMLDPVRPLLQQALMQAPPLPGALDELKLIPDDTQAVELRLTAGQGIGGSISLHANDDEAAERMDRRIAAALKRGVN